MRGPRVVGAEIALASVSASVAFGVQRLFADGGWIGPLAFVVVAVHGISALARRARLGILLQVLAVTAVVFLGLSWWFAGDTFSWGLPSTDTIRFLNDALATARLEYPTARAPVAALDGFVLAAAIGMAVVALMADIAAFSLRAPLQALVPPFTLFVFCALLGSGDAQISSALLFVVSSLAFVLTVRGLDQSTTTVWMPGDQQRGPNALLRLGAGLIALAAIGAVVIGPALPGAADSALWTWRGGGGPGNRVIVSPLVDIRTRIVNQSQEIAFVVRSPQASYWRLMSLDDFDGQQWTISSRFREVAGSFALTRPAAGSTLVDQQIEIRALASRLSGSGGDPGTLLPAAYLPTEIDVPDGTVTFDDHSSTLLLDRVADDGFEYTVSSQIPTFTAEQLRAADDDELSSAVTERYVELPELDARVVDLAAEITAAAPTTYDKALALQEFFRTRFRYSTDVAAGSGQDAIVTFLFESQAGYCEQFAASFAAMARSLGIPSRVAVGFTEGDQSRADPEVFTVRGGNAHAWPEVYFRGVGWVPFEPTPGRIAPGSAAWTTLDDSEGTDADPEAPEENPEDQLDPVIPPELDPLLPEFDVPQDAGGAPTDSGWSAPWPLQVLVVVVLAFAAVVGLVEALAVGRRTLRRRRVEHDPVARIDLAWTESVEALSRRGRVPRDSETHPEYAQRVAGTMPGAAEALDALSRQVATACYSGVEPSDSEVASACELSHDVVRATTRNLPWWRRLAMTGDPRRLRSTRPRRARRSATVVSTG